MVRAVNVGLGALALFHFRFQGRWMVRAVNLGLGALALFHLSYLGLMFDNSGDQEEVRLTVLDLCLLRAKIGIVF